MLTDQFTADLKQAMLAKVAVRLSTLRMLKAAIEYHKIEKNQEALIPLAAARSGVRCKSNFLPVPSHRTTHNIQ